MKKILSAVLIVALLAMMLCVGAVTVSAGGVDDRLAQVQAIFPEGSYFTTTGGPSSGSGAAECHYPSVVSQRLGYNWTNMWDSWSCCGFAHFVFRYIFGTEFTWSGAATVTETGVSNAEQHALFSSCRPGDVIYWRNNNGWDHWIVFLGYESGSHIWAYDCNINGECKVTQYHRFDMSYIAANCAVLKHYRATNYDAVNGTESYNTVSIPQGNYLIWNHATGRQLVVEGSVDVSQQNISAHPITTESGMKFEITETSIGYRIRPHCSANRIVNVYSDNVMNGDNVNLLGDTVDPSKRWLFEPVDDGYYIIRNAQNPSCVLAQQDGGNNPNCIVETYNGGNHQKWGLTPIETEKCVVSDLQITDVSADGYTVTVTVSDNVSVRRVMFPTWTTTNGQDELLWADGTLSGQGACPTATFRVNRADHNNEYGEYCTDIYALDSSANETVFRVLLDFTADGVIVKEPAPENNAHLTVTIETVKHAGPIQKGEEIAFDLTASAAEDLNALEMRLCFDDSKWEFVSGEFKGALKEFDIKAFNGAPVAPETDSAEVWITAAKTNGGVALAEGEPVASVTLRARREIAQDEVVGAYFCDVTTHDSVIGQYELTAEWINGGVVIVPYPKGDVTRDGNIGLNDAATVFYAVNGLLVLDEEKANLADVNDDGNIGIEDVMRLFYYVNNVVDIL